MHPLDSLKLKILAKKKKVGIPGQAKKKCYYKLKYHHKHPAYSILSGLKIALVVRVLISVVGTVMKLQQLFTNPNKICRLMICVAPYLQTDWPGNVQAERSGRAAVSIRKSAALLEISFHQYLKRKQVAVIEWYQSRLPCSCISLFPLTEILCNML